MKYAIISVNAMAMIICSIILYGNRFETTQRTSKRKMFGVLVTLNLLATAADLLSWLTDGEVRLESLSFFFSSVSLVMSFAVQAGFVMFLYVSISEKQRICFSHFKWVLMYCGAAVLVSVVCCISGQLFSIRNGVYQEEQFYELYLVCNLVSLILIALLVFGHFRYLGKHDSLGMLSYVVIPLAGVALNVVYPNFSVIYAAVSFSLLLIFIMLQSEHECALVLNEKQKTHQTLHDEMTGLQNRRAYVNAIDQMVSQNGYVGVVFCDINGLKYTNDHYGHQAGDSLILKFSETLLNVFRKNEIYRISGDEFVVLLPEISGDMMYRRIEELQDRLRFFETPPAAFGSSFGSKKDVEELIKQAEDSMYQQKQAFYQKYPELKR